MSAKEEMAQSAAKIQHEHLNTDSGIPEEDLARAYVYRLLAGFLARPPLESDLNNVNQGNRSPTEFGNSYDVFAHLCKQADADTVSTEYHDLFIGVGRGEILPYASYYLTGFLNEKPLAKLRNDMTNLGIEKDSSNNDPEDHIAAIFEIMAGLIVGDYAEPASLDEQKRFFQKHISPWAKHFFDDLASAKTSVFYASLAELGRIFLEIEESAFQMID